MPQSLSKVLLHITFSTKNREKCISESVQPKLYAYLAGSCHKNGSHAYRVGGTENHVHIACTLSRVLAISKLLEEIKKESSKWMKTQDTALKNFTWQAGYGCFSLGLSQLPILVKYIDNQRVHHQKRTYKEEFLETLDKYAIEYDEKYLWD